MSGWYARNKHRYPDNWADIAYWVKAIAGFRCEACGARKGDPGVSLGVDHIVDHDPAACFWDNLAALCSVCHLRRHHLRPKPQTKEEAIARLRARVELERAQLCLPLITRGK